MYKQKSLCRDSDSPSAPLPASHLRTRRQLAHGAGQLPAAATPVSGAYLPPSSARELGNLPRTGKGPVFHLPRKAASWPATASGILREGPRPSYSQHSPQPEPRGPSASSVPPAPSAQCPRGTKDGFCARSSLASQLRNPELRVPGLFITGCEQTCLNITL